MKPYPLSEYLTFSLCVVLFFALCVLFGGDPDLMDHLIGLSCPE